ncbi:S-layer homology domain-containing protein [Paenibacillus glucanolyticus]
MIASRKKCLILLLAGMLVIFGFEFGTHSTPSAQAADVDSYNLKLMTFNIRNGGTGKEAEEWVNRKALVARTIDSFAPDVLGMQEGHLHGINDLLGSLNGTYASIGTSRFGNTEEEYNNIMYRSDKFDVVQWGQFWLSETPDIVGSKSSYDPAWPRMCTWAKFKDKDNPGAEFYYFNTHFGLTAGAQLQGAQVILDQIARHVTSPDVPVFVGGDLNVQEDSAAFQALQNSDLSDTWADAGHAYTDDDGTFSNFEGLTDTGHIDWIFQRNVQRIHSIEINYYNENGLYPSDHYPVQLVVDISLTGRVGQTVPSAPRDVYAVLRDDLTRVVFSPSPDDGGSAILNYKVTAWQDNQAVKTVEGTASPISVTGLDADGDYTFTVTAENANGESVPSSPSKPIKDLANQSLGKPYLSAAVSSDYRMSGTLTITPTSVPIYEQEYALYWGDADGKLSETPLIATIPAGESEVNYTFNKAPIPDGATTILIYTRILGSDSTSYAQEPLPTAGIQPMQIEDFTDVSDWTDLRYGKITATDGIGLISVDGPPGRAFGYAGIPVTYNLTDLPILRLKIDSLDEGAMWALKLHTKAGQGSGDIKIQGDTNETGEFSFDLRKATGWSGEKSFIIKLFPIGVEKSFRISELSARPAVELDAEEGNSVPVAPSRLIASASNASVALSWNAVADADRYAVYKYAGIAAPLDPADWQPIETSVTGATYTVTDLANGTSYAFAVKAVNAHGESDYSDAVIAMPTASSTPSTPSAPSAPPVPDNVPTVDNSVIKSSNGSIVIPAGRAGEVGLGDAVLVTVPAGAAERELRITLERLVDTALLKTDQGVIFSDVFEALKNIPDNFKKPVTVSLKFDPSAVTKGQRVAIFYYDEIDKNWVEIDGKIKDKWITAEVDHFAKFAVLAVKQGDDNTPNPPSPTFSDIGEHWAESAIHRAVNLELINGYSDGTFKPNKSVTRAEFTVMLMGILKNENTNAAPTFKDQNKIGEWAVDSVVQAVTAGIVGGYKDGSFRPNTFITRAEMAVMIAKALQLPMDQNTNAGFSDDAIIPQWAKAAINDVRKIGIISGRTGNIFAPSEPVTRAEAVTLLLRVLEQHK